MPTADLTISMDDGTTTVAPGAATSYTIVVSNNGPDAVTGATVFDSLPDGITGNSWLATGSTGGGSVTGPAIGSGPLATTVDLPVGGAVVFTFTVLVNPSLTTGSLINLAVVLAPAGTPTPLTAPPPTPTRYPRSLRLLPVLTLPFRAPSSRSATVRPFLTAPIPRERSHSR